MAISDTTVELRKDDVVAATPVDCDLLVFDKSEIYLYYGNSRVAAVVDTDFVVTLDNAEAVQPTWPTKFSFTPTAALITKIDALIADNPTGEENVVWVRRRLDYTTDFQETDAFLRTKIAREFDRTIMRLQQMAFGIGESVETTEANAASALASKIAAGISEANAATSEGNAATSETNAAASAAAAATSEGNAATSETNAAASAAAAATSETNAATSEGNADDSAVAAAASEANAEASEAAALTQANRAESEADRAEGYASAVANGVSLQGDWDASAGTFPGDANTRKGYLWKVTVAGTVDSVEFGVDDSIIAKVDNPGSGTYADKWFKVEGGTITASQITAALGYTPANAARTITASGLATGGGDLSVNRTIDVPVASQAEAEAGTVTNKAMTPARVEQMAAARAPRGHIHGLEVTPAATEFDVAAGEAASDDATTPRRMVSPAITKTYDAWAVGDNNGSLDTGTIAASTWYHLFDIMRSDTGVVDKLLSLSADAPTLPANYDHKRHIGFIKTNSSSEGVPYTQYGDNVYWAAIVLDVSTTWSNGTQNTVTLSVPTGKRVEPFFRVNDQGTTNNSNVAFRSPDLQPSDTTTTVESAGGDAGNVSNGTAPNRTQTSRSRVLTNTSGQLVFVVNHSSGASNGNVVRTLGWAYARGRI